jgi:hypothetical protein
MHLDWAQRAFVPAAEAMPEPKFFWAPTSGSFAGVRNFAEQIVHVGEVNFALSASILGEALPSPSNLKNGYPGGVRGRAAVLRYMHDRFSYTQSALSSIRDENARLPIKHPLLDLTTTRMGLAVVCIAHPFNHYGQMVEYLRMNSIVPPASRG